LVGLSSRVHNATPDYLTPFAHIGDWWVDE